MHWGSHIHSWRLVSRHLRMDLSPLPPPLTTSHLNISGGRPQGLIASGGLVWVVCRAVPLVLWCVNHRFPFPIATGVFFCFYTLHTYPASWPHLRPLIEHHLAASCPLTPSQLVLIGIHFYKYVKYEKIQRVEPLFDSILKLAVCMRDFGLIWSPWTPHAEAQTPVSRPKEVKCLLLNFNWHLSVGTRPRSENHIGHWSKKAPFLSTIPKEFKSQCLDFTTK